MQRCGRVNMNKNIAVSVICITYNQKNYIKDALDSFLCQKVNFEYEILINDDCSSDGTAEIVKQYYKKYPNIIKPFFQKENQYSKGVGPIKDILLPTAKGKYLAICEGDDYWIDNKKLQIQYDYMEKHPECGLCIHNALLVDKNKEKIGEVRTVKNNAEISINDVVINGGDFIATSSIFARMPKDGLLPDYFNILTLDYTWQVFFASNGNHTFGFCKPMSVYRIGGETSWSTLREKDFEAYKIREINLLLKKNKMRKAFNEYNHSRFTTIVNEANIYDEIKCNVCIKNYKGLRKKEARLYLKKLGLKEKTKYRLLMYAPFLYSIYKTLKLHIKKIR